MLRPIASFIRAVLHEQVRREAERPPVTASHARRP